MIKLFLFLIGLVAGGAAAAGWLLSEPGSGTWATPARGDSSASSPFERAKAKLQGALAEGDRARDQTQRALQQKLDSYRSGKGGSSST